MTDQQSAVARRDTRADTRLKRRLIVRYRCGGPLHWAFTGDIGPNGLSILSNHIEPPATVLQIEIDLPGGATLNLDGVVAWARRVPVELQQVRRGGFGVRILRAPRAWHEFFSELEGGLLRVSARGSPA